MAEKRWIAETLFDDLGFRMSYQVDKVLYEMQTEHQHLVLFEHPFFGKMLMLDGATQITKRDEFIYQEMMSHVPLFAHGQARDVLIIGGGDCGIAEEVLKHKSVKRLTKVEIDPATSLLIASLGSRDFEWRAQARGGCALPRGPPSFV